MYEHFSLRLLVLLAVVAGTLMHYLADFIFILKENFKVQNENDSANFICTNYFLGNTIASKPLIRL